MANVLLGIHCVVSGCGSTLRKVNQWKAKPCLTHKGKSHSSCMCPEPYQLFKFPAEVKLQKIWLDRVRRPDLEINNLTRVCSIHFVEGKPTRRNYFPSMNLSSMKRNEIVKMEQMKIEYEGGDNNEETSSGQLPHDEERGKVSLVPMELLQEQPNNDCDDEKLTVSRFHYPTEESIDVQGDYNNLERGSSRTGAVTITRVKPIANIHSAQALNNSVSDGTQQAATNANEARRRVTAPANRFIKFGSNQRPIVTLTPRPRPTSSSSIQVATTIDSVRTLSSSTVNNTVQTQMFKVNNDLEQEELNADSDHDSEYGYMDDDDDDDGGDSSELSDIGIDIHPIRPQTTAPTSSSQSQSPRVKFLHKHKQQDIKPKTIPVFAVSPSTQQNNNSSFEPIITSVSTVSAMKPIDKPINMGKNNTNEIAGTTSAAMKPTPNSISKDQDQDVEVVYSAIPPMPLATYDPTKQQLQIANPIKYIQECHTRIAQLISEKQQLQTTNVELETKLRKLQEENNTLRREVVYQSTKAIQRVRQNQPPPTQRQPPKSTPFNLVPIRTLATATSRTSEGGTSPKRFRYVIKRPANIFKPNAKLLKK